MWEKNGKFSVKHCEPFSTDHFLFEDFTTKHFLSDVGGELRLRLFTFYAIPLTAFFQVAHPLNRDRELAGSQRQRDFEALPPAEKTPQNRPRKVDRWRFYFGLGF